MESCDCLHFFMLMCPPAPAAGHQKEQPGERKDSSHNISPYNLHAQHVCLYLLQATKEKSQETWDDAKRAAWRTWSATVSFPVRVAKVLQYPMALPWYCLWGCSRAGQPS